LVTERWVSAAARAIWRGQLSAAREAVDTGLTAVRRAEDRLATCQLLAIGLRAEADLAERSRLSRVSSETLEIKARADSRLAELEAIVGRFGDRRSAAPRELHALPATARAEHFRTREHSDPTIWAAAVEAARWSTRL